MSLLDPLQPGFQKLYVNGIERSPARGGVNLVGDWSVTDDPNNNRKNIEAPLNAAGGAWVTRFEPDLLGAAAYTFPVSAVPLTQTIGGITWTAVNINTEGTISVNAVANTGISIAKSSAGSGGLLSGNPYIYFDLNQISPLTWFSGAMRIQMQFAVASGFATNGHEFTAGILAEDNTATMIAARVVRDGGALKTGGQLALGGVSADYELELVAAGANDTIEMRWLPPLSADFGYGTYSGGYPTITNIQGAIRHLTEGPAGVRGMVINSSTTATNDHGLRVFFSVANGGSGTPAMYLRRLRVQQWVVN